MFFTAAGQAEASLTASVLFPCREDRDALSVLGGTFVPYFLKLPEKGSFFMSVTKNLSHYRTFTLAHNNIFFIILSCLILEMYDVKIPFSTMFILFYVYNASVIHG